jgi:intracellular septation protein
MNPRLKTVLDLAPLGVFFLAYRLEGLFAATAALIVCTVVSLCISYYYEKKISVMPLVSGIAVTVFGCLTLWLHDEYFIKIKPTLVNLIFASILLGGLWFKKPLMRYVLGEALHLQDVAWFILSRRWGFFFIFLAVLNELIWRNFSTDFWVNFKVFGMLSCTLAFTLAQLPLINRYMIEEQQEP